MRHHVGDEEVREVVLGQRSLGQRERIEIDWPIGEALGHGAAKLRGLAKALKHRKDVFGEVAKQFPDGGEASRVDQGVLDALRQDPEGHGVVVGIDFTVEPYVSPVR